MIKHRVKKAVIPAGGLGTRFLPWSKVMPKEMLPLIDRPVIDYVVEELFEAGIEEVVVVTRRGKESIINHFDQHPQLVRQLRDKNKLELAAVIEKQSELCFYYVQQPEPRGLGHAVLMARSFLGDGAFVLLLPDELYISEPPVLEQLLTVYGETGDPVIGLTTVPHEEVERYGVVDPCWANSDVCIIKDMVEKPKPARAPSNTVICGRYVLTPDIFNKLENTAPGIGGEIQLTDALRALLMERQLRGKLITGDRLDVGTIPAYLETVLRIALQHPEYGPDLARAVRQQLNSLPEGSGQ